MSAGTSPAFPPPPRAGYNTLVYLGELWTYLRKGRVKAGAGIRSTQTADGIILSLRSSSDAADTGHPFKISAAFDDAAAPTVCMVLIQSGSLQGTLATGSTYAGIPLFEGSGGSPLDDSPAPDYDVGVTARTNYLYLVMTTDEYGLLDTCWIDHLLVAAPVPPVDVPYVQPGFPLASDTGTAGVYYWLIGSVTVAGTDPNKTITISQAVETDLGFRVCGGAGLVYTA